MLGGSGASYVQSAQHESGESKLRGASAVRFILLVFLPFLRSGVKMRAHKKDKIVHCTSSMPLRNQPSSDHHVQSKETLTGSISESHRTTSAFEKAQQPSQGPPPTLQTLDGAARLFFRLPSSLRSTDIFSLLERCNVGLQSALLTSSATHVGREEQLDGIGRASGLEATR